MSRHQCPDCGDVYDSRYLTATEWFRLCFNCFHQSTVAYWGWPAEPWETKLDTKLRHDPVLTP